MSSLQLKTISLLGAVVSIALMLPKFSIAQSDPTVTNDQPNQVSIAYIPPINSTFQELHDVLRDHLALEKAQETRRSHLAFL
jgi:hypothetical protein